MSNASDNPQSVIGPSEIKKLRFLIADDHPIVRGGLRQVLSEAFEGAEIGEVTNAQEALEQIWSRPWDVVILDISMPGRSGLDVLKDIRREKPDLPVLFLSMHAEEEYAVRVLKGGASGYITKERAAKDMIAAVEKVLNGGKYVSPTLAEHLAAHLAEDSGQPPHTQLSDREFEVFRKLVDGQTVSEIGAELSLSVKTISTYRTRLLEKLGLHTNQDLIRYAVQHNLGPS